MLDDDDDDNVVLGMQIVGMGFFVESGTEENLFVEFWLVDMMLSILNGFKGLNWFLFSSIFSVAAMGTLSAGPGLVTEVESVSVLTHDSGDSWFIGEFASFLSALEAPVLLSNISKYFCLAYFFM